MVWYKDPKFFQHEDSTAYDQVLEPGQPAPYSGIYRCESCNAEMVIDAGRTLPPTHAKAAQGHRVRWRLVAFPHHLT